MTKSYRGSPGQQVIVHSPDQGPACGLGFEEGHDYLVYGYTSSNGELSTNRCSRTHEVIDRAADADIQWLEALPKAPPGATIFGHIQTLRLNQDGGYAANGLPDIAVSINGPQSKTLSSDADGNFRAAGLAPGTYVVSAVTPSRYARFPKSTVTLQDHACAEINWSTRLDGHIRGHVYFADGAPAAGLYLTAKTAEAEANEPWTSQSSYTTTNSDGAFDFAELPPGSYVFAVNMDFTSVKGEGYYRKAFFPGTVHRSEAAVLNVGAGETIDNLRFFLPPDSPPPSVPLHVTVLGFDGKPVDHAEIVARDDIWESSVTPLMATADANGKATLTLRPGSHYDIEVYVNLPDFSQACAEPVGVDARNPLTPLVFVLSHHVGNCLPFKKR